MHTASRYHDISCGHRVVGHENKCRHLHGHNYRVHFHCKADIGSQSLDSIGRVIDFGVIKEKLCMWLEHNWDHRFLIWEEDPLLPYLQEALAEGLGEEYSLCEVAFNPTAENMAEFLVNLVGPFLLAETGVLLYKVEIEETRKCSASYEYKKGCCNDKV